MQQKNPRGPGQEVHAGDVSAKSGQMTFASTAQDSNSVVQRQLFGFVPSNSPLRYAQCVVSRRGVPPPSIVPAFEFLLFRREFRRRLLGDAKALEKFAPHAVVDFRRIRPEPTVVLLFQSIDSGKAMS